MPGGTEPNDFGLGVGSASSRPVAVAPITIEPSTGLSENVSGQLREYCPDSICIVVMCENPCNRSNAPFFNQWGACPQMEHGFRCQG